MVYKIQGLIVIDDNRDGHFRTIKAFAGPPKFSGAESYGYSAGGGSPPGQHHDEIERWPFASASTNASDVGNLTGAWRRGGGSGSRDYGYYSGGTSFISPGSSDLIDVIDRWPFASATTNASYVGDLLSAIEDTSATQKENDYGYTCGGDDGSTINVIQRWPFASATTNASDVGDLINSIRSHSATCSYTYGYATGGDDGSTINVIQRWPFASATTNASDVGNLLSAIEGLGSAFSYAYEYGYTCGGQVGPGSATDIIDRWPFTSGSTNASDVGDLTLVVKWTTGSSSTTYGYCHGGNSPPAPTTTQDIIERWPFASATTNASDVGNLATSRYLLAGTQV